MQNVVEKILERAREEAEEILKRYKLEAEKIKQDYENRISFERQRFVQEIEDLKKRETLRSIAKEKLAQNKKLTKEMEEEINGVIKEAVTRLTKDRRYLDFLKELIINSQESEGELFLSTNDLKKYGSAIEKFIKKENLNFKITGDDDMIGGIIIKRGKNTYLGSIDVIVELIRDELKIEIARILFAGSH
ncbi:MAG: hypothetical protein ABIL70_06910 [candidate division WOR-3 bacterium]